jgi:hypothetical protein
MRHITITFDPEGRQGFNVTDDCGRHCGGSLTTGEMLEMVIKLAVVNTQLPRYPMLTDDGWAERERERDARLHERRVDAAYREHVDHMGEGPLPF